MNDADVLAGRWRRLAATAVDAVLVPGLTVVLVMVFEVMEDPEDFTSAWWIWWVFVLAVASYLVLNGYGLARSGQTLGKRLFGIAVVRAGALEPASFWKLICVRALFFPLLFVVVYPDRSPSCCRVLDAWTNIGTQRSALPLHDRGRRRTR